MDINITKSPDFTLLAAIHAEGFAHPWDAQAFAELFAIPGTLAFIAPDGNGFGILRVVMDEAEILTLAVRRVHRRSGIGNALVERMIAAAGEHGAASLFLEVRESNEAAIRLYCALGFDAIAQRKGYYDTGDGSREDAVIMRKACGMNRRPSHAT